MARLAPSLPRWLPGHVCVLVVLVTTVLALMGCDLASSAYEAECEPDVEAS